MKTSNDSKVLECARYWIRTSGLWLRRPETRYSRLFHLVESIPVQLLLRQLSGVPVSKGSGRAATFPIRLAQTRHKHLGALVRARRFAS